MKKICIIDSYSYKNFHETFNASLLIECSTISNELVYYSGLSALNSIRNLVNKQYLKNVVFKTIPVIEGSGKINILLHDVLSALFNCILLIKINNSIIIYNYNNLLSLSIINILNKLFRKNIVIVCHGEFEIFNLNIKHKYNIYGKINVFFLKKYFLNKNAVFSKYLIFFVLGDNIKLNLKKIFPDNIYKNIYSIEHSYIDKSMKNINKYNELPIKIGMIGYVRKAKNMSDVINLAKNLAVEISEKKIDFSITDAAAINCEDLRLAGINVPEGKKKLSMEEYYNKINNLDYVLFFYSKNMYQFTASGPFFDALLLEKPIIALKNSYFDYMFKKYGEFGILCDSIDEMTRLIKKIIEMDEIKKYDFKSIKMKLHPENISLQLLKIFEVNNFI